MTDMVDGEETPNAASAPVARAMDTADLLTAVESGSVTAMPLLMQASRVARDLGSSRIEQWLEWEMRGYDGAGTAASQMLRYSHRWINEAEGSAITDPLPAIEERIEGLRVGLRGMGIVEGDAPPFAGQEAVFFDDAASAAVRQVAVEMQQMTGQLNRLVTVHSNAMAMLHAFADNAFTQHRHLLPEGFRIVRKMAEAPAPAIASEAKAVPEIEASTVAQEPEPEVLDGVPITDRDAEGFDDVLNSDDYEPEADVSAALVDDLDLSETLDAAVSEMAESVQEEVGGDVESLLDATDESVDLVGSEVSAGIEDVISADTESLTEVSAEDEEAVQMSVDAIDALIGTVPEDDGEEEPTGDSSAEASDDSIAESEGASPGWEDTPGQADLTERLKLAEVEDVFDELDEELESDTVDVSDSEPSPVGEDIAEVADRETLIEEYTSELETEETETADISDNGDETAEVSEEEGEAYEAMMAELAGMLDESIADEGEAPEAAEGDEIEADTPDEWENIAEPEKSDS